RHGSHAERCGLDPRSDRGDDGTVPAAHYHARDLRHQTPAGLAVRGHTMSQFPLAHIIVRGTLREREPFPRTKSDSVSARPRQRPSKSLSRLDAGSRMRKGRRAGAQPESKTVSNFHSSRSFDNQEFGTPLAPSVMQF